MTAYRGHERISGDDDRASTKLLPRDLPAAADILLLSFLPGATCGNLSQCNQPYPLGGGYKAPGKEGVRKGIGGQEGLLGEKGDERRVVMVVISWRDTSCRRLWKNIASNNRIRSHNNSGG